MICKVKDCEGKVIAKNYCRKHYSQVRRHGKTIEIKKYIGCLVEGCPDKHYIKGYCRRHSYQIKKYKQIIKTHYDKNEIVKRKKYAEILLYNRKREVISKAIIDLENIEKCKKIRWFSGAKGYVMGGINSIHLSHFIMNHKSNRRIYVDHINRNPLDNRKNNLRLALPRENIINRNRKGNVTKFIGVYSNSKNRFKVLISVNNKRIYLGNFKTKEEGAKVYNEAAIKYNGKFAILNKVVS